MTLLCSIGYLVNEIFLFWSISVGVETGNCEVHHTPYPTNHAVDGEVGGVTMKLVNSDRVVVEEERGSPREEAKHQVEESSQKSLHLFWRLGIYELQPCNIHNIINKQPVPASGKHLLTARPHSVYTLLDNLPIESVQIGLMLAQEAAEWSKGIACCLKARIQGGKQARCLQLQDVAVSWC